MKKLLVFFLLISLCGAATLSSDGSRADVQAKIDAAVDGDIVTIPSGSFTWSSGVSISEKGLHLRGAGSGRVVAYSVSSVSVGTGTKTFTITRDTIAQSAATITAGDTLTIHRTAGEVFQGNVTGNLPWMRGTVNSYNSGTGALEMNITMTNHSGTHAEWLITTEPSSLTTITHGHSGDAITITPDTSHSTELSGIRFVTSDDTNNGKHLVKINRTASGKPVLVHDVFLHMVHGDHTGGFFCVTNSVIFWNSSFVSLPWAAQDLAITYKNGASDTESSWSTASTMGAADTTGTRNGYIEQCDFHGFLNATDFDDSARVVVRNSFFNIAGSGSHGRDTSPVGVRHWEVYDNYFRFPLRSDGSATNNNWQIFMRGGTGVITGNTIDDVNSTGIYGWGDKAELNFGVWSLGADAGGYGSGDGGDPDYPASRQFGFGYVTGASGTENGVYRGDAEPAYVWNNSGTQSIGLSDGGTGGVTDPDDIADYIQSGRDYILNAKPGWARYTYPHPARGSAPSATPGNGTVSGPTTVAIELSLP
jgi:hypothetical protein